MGAELFRFLGNEIQYLLLFADSGAIFLFGGKSGNTDNFVFSVLPIVVFFSTVIASVVKKAYKTVLKMAFHLFSIWPKNYKRVY